MASGHPPSSRSSIIRRRNKNASRTYFWTSPPPGPSTVESRQHGPITSAIVDEGDSNVPTASTALLRFNTISVTYHPHFPFVVPLLLSSHFPHRSTFFFIVLHHSVTFRNLPLLIHVHCIVTCHHVTFQKVPLHLVS